MRNRSTLAAMLVAALFAVGTATPTVRLQVPPPGRWGIEDLWKATVTSDTVCDVWFEGWVFEASHGQVFHATTKPFRLKLGSSNYFYRDVQLDKTETAKGYETFVARQGTLPEGRYSFKLILQPFGIGDSNGFEVKPVGPPRLLTPRDGTKLPPGEKYPEFNWTPSQPPAPGVKYSVKVAEVLPGQTKEEALRANKAWYEDKGVTHVNLRYPVAGRAFAADRQYAWQVRMLDSDGRTIGESEIWGFSLEEARHPPVRLPVIGVERQLTRTHNYYDVVLTIRNRSADTLRDLSVYDRSAGLQCLDDAAVMHGTTGASYLSTSCSTWTDTSGMRSAIRFSWERLHPGGRMIVQYRLVPMLLSPLMSVTPKIGDSTTISYRVNDRWYLAGLRVQRLPTDIADALREADYLIVTCPQRLFGASPPELHRDVHRLFATMARLAKEKNGVLGSIPRDWNQFDLKDVLNHSWGNSLTTTYKSSGYLLLVGQDDIVPAWNVPVGGGAVQLSDYPYSNLSGDEQCELRVGRSIGLTAQELAIPIQTSLDVWRGLARYDGSRGLIVSAAEGAFEEFVMQAAELSDSLRRKTSDVFCVLGEMFITRMAMLREAFWIDSGRDLFKLSRWALREWLWNGHTLGAIDQLSEIDGMSRTAVQDSAIALAKRLIPVASRPADDIDLVIKALGKSAIQPWEDDVPRSDEYVRALAKWLLEQRGITPPADTVGRALREGEEIQYARRGQRLPVYNYRDTPEAAAQDRSSYVRRMAQDRDILGYRGHGGPGSWAWTLDDWATSSCPAEPLSFGSHRPVVLGFTCSSGDYTEVGGHGPVSIARCFLRNGAGIYVGATRTTYCCTNRTLYLETFRRWQTRVHFGDAFVDLKNTCCLRDHEWILETTMYNLYGDPKYRRR